jgi:hypothetical protein
MSSCSPVFVPLLLQSLPLQLSSTLLPLLLLLSNLLDWNEQFKDENFDHLRPLGEYIGTSFSPEDNDFRSEMENVLSPFPTPIDPDALSISPEDFGQRSHGQSIRP